MTMKTYNIPIFVPHRGCPFDCVFCNQKRITGTQKEVTADDVHNIIGEYLKTLPSKNRRIEAAFFGGSFTGIPINEQSELLADQMVLEFPVLADYAVIFVDGKTLYLTHGHKYNPNNLPPIKKGDYLVNGHTHILANEDMGDFTYLNPGSVSIPKGGNPHTYMIYENGEFKIKELK